MNSTAAETAAETAERRMVRQATKAAAVVVALLALALGGYSGPAAATDDGRSPMIDVREAVFATQPSAPASDGSTGVAEGPGPDSSTLAPPATASAGGECGSQSEPVDPGPPRSGVVLTPASVAYGYDCRADTVGFTVTTTTTFPEAQLGSWAVLIDTDGSGLLTGEPVEQHCHGGEHIAAVFQGGDGAPAATLLTMGDDCDTVLSRSPASLLVDSTTVTVTVSAADLRRRDDAGADLGRASSLDWVGELSSMTEVLNDQPGSPAPLDGHRHLMIPSVGSYTPVVPRRVLDTRSGEGAPAAAVGTGGTLDFVATGLGEPVPAGITAVVLHVAAVDATSPTFVTLWPSGARRPLASNVNVRPGALENNLVVVKTGTGGLVSVYNHLGSAEVVADLYGYYTDTVDSGGSYVTGVTPTRVLDTRDGTGPGRRTPLGGGETLALPITGWPESPVPADATAVVVNLTAVAPTGGTYLRAWGDGEAPTVATLNVDAGRTLPNMAVVPLADDGSIRIQNAFGEVDVVVDVLAFFAAPAPASGAPPGAAPAGRYVAATPVRLLDTRDGTGGVARALGSEAVTLRVAGRAGVPDHVTAVVLAVAAVDPSSPSYLTLYPAGGERPLASNLNMTSGRTVANLVTVAPGPDGTVTIYNHSGTTHVIADLAGWVA